MISQWIQITIVSFFIGLSLLYVLKMVAARPYIDLQQRAAHFLIQRRHPFLKKLGLALARYWQNAATPSSACSDCSACGRCREKQKAFQAEVPHNNALQPPQPVPIKTIRFSKPHRS